MESFARIINLTVRYVISIGLFVPICVSADQLYMLSQPGDYIGQGQVTDIDTTTHTFSAQKNYDNGVSIRVNGSTWWYLDFAAPGEVELTQGIYEGAVRWPFQSITQPGLSVSGNGRGCNTLTGQFTVHEVSYNSDGTIGQFAADFEQHCSGAEPGLFGAIRFNSDVPVDISIPAVFAKAGDDQYAIDGQLVTLDASDSYTSDGSAITSYYWSQVSGPVVYLDDPTIVTPSFTVPIVQLGGVDLEFELEVMTSNGALGTDTMTVALSSKSDPQTFISMDSETGDYIGQGQQYLLGLNDGTFTVDSVDADHVRLLFRGQDTWSFNFAAPDGTGLSTQAYWDATRYPFNDPSVPGLSVSGAGRGCNTLTGKFNVLEIVTDANGIYTNLAVDFEQHCEGQPPALFGSVRLNYVDPSVPIASAGNDQLVLSGQQVVLNGIGSHDSDGYIATYQWTQVSGIAVTLQNETSEVPMFTAPPVPLGSIEVLTFELLVTDNLGYMAKDSVTITVEGVDQLNYCDARGQNTSYEWIEGIALGVDLRTSGNNQGYADYSVDAAIQLQPGANAITLTPGFRWSSYTERWRVWIDWNQDGEFANDELVLSATSRSTVNGSITVPDNAAAGETRMRVALRYGSYPAPCGSFYYGEVEDYTVIMP